MTADFLFRFLLGHLFGDYLFQNTWMALGKKNRILPCFIHCLIYTAIMLIAISPEFFCLDVPDRLAVFVLIFLTHAILDGTRLINKYLHFIRGRSFEHTTEFIHKSSDIELDQYMISYTVFIQTVADNTVHLFLMYIVFRIFLW